MTNLQSRIWAGVPVLIVLFLQLPLEAQERSRRNPYTSPRDVAGGWRHYRRLCSNCHGQDGRGVVGLGPSLAGKLRHGSSDAALFDVVSGGVAGGKMPAFSFDERQTWQLVSFVRSIGDKARAEAEGDPAAGEALFRGRAGCISCHRVGNEGGRRGPDLRRVAAATPAGELLRSIKRPNEKVRAKHFRVRAVTSEGTLI
ncbi:MAG: c-type cytochrome, partial [bacterium]|nr:c-type cytochrome [bacterium]